MCGFNSLESAQVHTKIHTILCTPRNDTPTSLTALPPPSQNNQITTHRLQRECGDQVQEAQEAVGRLRAQLADDRDKLARAQAELSQVGWL